MEEQSSQTIKRRGSTQEFPSSFDSKKPRLYYGPLFNPKSLQTLAITACQRSSGIKPEEGDKKFDRSKLRTWLTKIMTASDVCVHQIFNDFFKNWKPYKHKVIESKISDWVKYMQEALVLHGARPQVHNNLLEAIAKHADLFCSSTDVLGPFDDGGEQIINAITFAQKWHLTPDLTSAHRGCLNMAFKKLIERKQVTQIDELIKNGANVNCVTHCGPLYNSISAKNIQIMTLLLNNGAQMHTIEGILSHIERSCGNNSQTREAMLRTAVKHFGYFLHPYQTTTRRQSYLISTEEICQHVESLADSQKAFPISGRIKAIKPVIDGFSKMERIEPFTRSLGLDL